MAGPMPPGLTAEAAPRVPAATRGPISGRPELQKEFVHVSVAPHLANPEHNPAIATIVSKAITTLSMVVPSRGDRYLGPGRGSG